MTPERRKRIADVVREIPDEELDRLFHGPDWLPQGFNTLANLIEREQYAGLEIRNRLQDALGNTLQAKKETSEILHKAGFVGMKYDGRFDGPCAVIFSDDDIKIVDHLRFREGGTKKKKASETASVPSEEEHQPTVVSSALGANIVKDLEELIWKT